jgi:hypothetical protein
VRAGELKGFKLERDVFVRRADIDEYILNHPVKTEAVIAAAPVDERAVEKVLQLAKVAGLPRRRGAA